MLLFLVSLFVCKVNARTQGSPTLGLGGCWVAVRHLTTAMYISLCVCQVKITDSTIGEGSRGTCSIPTAMHICLCIFHMNGIVPFGLGVWGRGRGSRVDRKNLPAARKIDWDHSCGT